jgi:hypothetical protein
MSRQIVVTFETPSCAYVRGHGSRTMLEELRGRPPVWATISRAWCVQPKTARDLVCLCEARGLEVIITREEALPIEVIAALDETAPAIEQGRLW